RQVRPAAALAAGVGAELAVVGVDPAVGADELAGQQLVVSEGSDAAGGADQGDRGVAIAELVEVPPVERQLAAPAEQLEQPEAPEQPLELGMAPGLGDPEGLELGAEGGRVPLAGLAD